MRRLSARIQHSCSHTALPISQCASARRYTTLPNQDDKPGKPRVTRKKYSELPLPPRGLLGGPSADILNDIDSTAQLLKPLSRARRPKPVAKPACAEEENDMIEPQVPPTKAGRTRTRKEAYDAAESLPREGTTEATLAQPNRRRRRVIKITEEPSSSSDSKNVPTSPLAAEILQNLKEFPHCLLLTRVGQFYESYFDQAEQIAHLLNIKLTSRRWGGQGNRVPMCGFPLAHLDKHLKTLVQLNQRFVALCEEFRRPVSDFGKDFDRRVVRIVTPGTLIDESFLNPYDNNYIMSLTTSTATTEAHQGANIGLAWIDISTGEFFSKSVVYESLPDELARISPREIVLPRDLEMDPSHPLREILGERRFFLAYAADPRENLTPDEPSVPPSDTVVDVEDPKETFVASFTENEQSAVTLLTSYLRANLLEHMPLLSSPSREGREARMQIDAHTIKALELKESSWDKSQKGTLLSTIRRTISPGGTRLLSRWLASPSTSLQEINARQSLVALFKDRPHLQTDLAVLLTGASDVTRLVQKFMMDRGDISDLRSLASTIHIWTSIQDRIQLERSMEAGDHGHLCQTQWANLEALFSRLTQLDELASRVSNALVPSSNESDPVDDAVDEPQPVDEDIVSCLVPTSSRDIRWTIRSEFSETLKSLHDTLRTLIEARSSMEKRFQIRFLAPSLTLRTSPGLGMHVHLARKREQTKIALDSQFLAISESGSTKAFANQEWLELGNHILQTTMSLRVAEKAAFDSLRTEVAEQFVHLRRNARVFDELDAILGFSKLASEMNFVRPQMTEDSSYVVTNGRHPTVERALLESSRVFVPNSVSLDESSLVRIQTGPNMAGKSTLLRQTALIAILAQAGSFVPADHAQLGIVDRVFSRVGAHDDLFQDRSTFMVEMIETAEILRRATPRSLVIMDEVGRGTTVNEGLAIAFAAIHHLVTINKCRVLFATHFHELADMLGYGRKPGHHGTGPFSRVSFYCSDINETEDGHITYSYRVQPGINRNSHGLKVAQLAGLPPQAIETAHQALAILRQNDEEERAGQAHMLQALGKLISDH